MLADRIVVAPRKSAFERWLDGLSPKHRAVVDEWLSNPAVSARTIRDAIREDDPEDGFTGVRVGAETISAWRRGESR